MTRVDIINALRVEMIELAERETDRHEEKGMNDMSTQSQTDRD